MQSDGSAAGCCLVHSSGINPDSERSWCAGRRDIWDCGTLSWQRASVGCVWCITLASNTGISRRRSSKARVITRVQRAALPNYDEFDAVDLTLWGVMLFVRIRMLNALISYRRFLCINRRLEYSAAFWLYFQGGTETVLRLMFYKQVHKMLSAIILCTSFCFVFVIFCGEAHILFILKQVNKFDRIEMFTCSCRQRKSNASFRIIIQHYSYNL